MRSYQPVETEKKWRNRWKEDSSLKADFKSKEKPKYYNLTMFPYPSGDRLHIGHWYNYGPVDTWGRYMKLKGYNVFQPMGFDSFGLPAENYAIKTGVHPAETTRQNIDKMKEQIRAIGGLYDLEGNVETSSPVYYKWTQWVFLKLYEKGLAYRKEAPVNWCNSCQTVLANEQVVDGRCERCKNEVIQRNLTQWFFKITDYAEKLLDYEGLDWPEKTILMQKHWIGKSEGAQFKFKVAESDLEFEVFSTRPETIFGATYCVLSPEHPLVDKIISKDRKKEIEDYRNQLKTKSELERTELNKNKSGIFTGAFAINPATKKEIPIWIADYVLVNYGTGAIMAVPGHDLRDFEFAKKYNLPVVCVVDPEHFGQLANYAITDKETNEEKVGGSHVISHDPSTESAEYAQEKFLDEVREGKHVHIGNGKMINSDFLNKLSIGKAKERITNWLEENEIGNGTVNYRLRDWLISRQRYWGVPIPIIYCEKCGETPVPEKDLPVVHPHITDYIPKGVSPLATSEDFVNVKCPDCGGDAKREVDTMDTFVDSSWYFLRYLDPFNEKQAWDKEMANEWMPVDMYIGGPEHACMHLLYARFFHRFFYDSGLVASKEPFKRLVHQGMITKDGAKMSKSKGNVVSPDEFVEKYGSDVFRMYLMFMGPFTEGGDWNDRGITGIARFVDRFFRMMQEEGSGESLNGVVHRTIARVTESMEKMNFNISIAALMELTNEALKQPLNKQQKEMMVRVIAPLAPHLAEEIWELMGNKETVFNQAWPEADPKFLEVSTVTYAIQVNGKLRDTMELAKGVSKEDSLAAARALPKVQNFLTGEVVKEIFVPDKIVGFVIKV